jgi:hypothetical protein
LRARRQNQHALKSLDPLQQVIDRGIGVAVVRVAHIAALAEQRIGFIEEQRRALEQRRQVLFRFADVLAGDRGQVDAVKRQRQRACQHVRRQRLAGAGRSVEQRGDVAPGRDAVALPRQVQSRDRFLRGQQQIRRH